MKLPIPVLIVFAAGAAFAQDQPTPREQQLLDMIEKLQARVTALESKLDRSAAPAPSPAPPAVTTTAKVVPPAAAPSPAPTAPPADPLAGTTINGELDTYYENNFNNPIGRDNLLRAYDVSSDSFSLSQADVVVENAADPDNDKRWGMRLDLQFGQATQTLQGSPSNEPRPEIYRNIFQAYGTYAFPVSKGLTIDFGKWASSLGIEGNYTKDQMNYSRSFWFDYLPFYHMGARVAYKINDDLTLNYWLTNGTQQTESFNNFKDEMWGLNLTPRRNVSWTFNYYLGQEHPDVIFYNNEAYNSPPPATTFPTLQGVPFAPIPDPPNGHLEIFDSYVTWQVTPSLTLAGEADYVIERLYTYSIPYHTDGGAGYIRYQLSKRFSVAGRAEYLSDRGGLFTGVTQAIKDQTVTLEYKIADGFAVFPEWRRDSSNQPYFLTSALGILKREQNTAGMGIVWWFGAKPGTW